jgi:hypothetical protein
MEGEEGRPEVQAPRADDGKKRLPPKRITSIWWPPADYLKQWLPQRVYLDLMVRCCDLELEQVVLVKAMGTAEFLPPPRGGALGQVASAPAPCSSPSVRSSRSGTRASSPHSAQCNLSPWEILHLACVHQNSCLLRVEEHLLGRVAAGEAVVWLQLL